MAIYTSPSISGYNSNPPSDDGTQSAANEIKWSTLKEKLPDPVKTLAETDITRTSTAFGLLLAAVGIRGLLLSNNGSDGDHDIDISAGATVDVGGAYVIQLSSAITKQLDATWAEGTNQGGLDTGAIASDTVYYTHVIRDSSSDTKDACFSTSPTSATVLSNVQGQTGGSGYDQSQLVGAFVTDSSANIIAFSHKGDEFRYTGAVVADVNMAAIATGDDFVTAALSVAADSIAHVYGSVDNSTHAGTLGRLHIRTSGAVDAANKQQAWAVSQSSGTFDDIGGIGSVLVNGSRQIDYTANEPSGAATVSIYTFGFRMLTRGAGA